MDANTFRVHAPTQIVFLCGGAIGPEDGEPTMLRDAFYRAAKDSPTEYRIVLAEAADPLTADAGYKDLLSFESDIAQVVGAILLFAESAGSLAELGAFAAMKTVAPSLIAVLYDNYYTQESFIRRGPVLFLETQFGDEWVHVLEQDEILINGQIELKKLSDGLQPAIERRLKIRSKWSSFNGENDGHVILLITGLCQELGAVTLTELRIHLRVLGIEDTRLHNFLYCSILLGWIKKIRKGDHIYYTGVGGAGNAVDYSMKDQILPKDKIRWRSDLRLYWKENDPSRLRAITEALT